MLTPFNLHCRCNIPSSSSVLLRGAYSSIFGPNVFGNRFHYCSTDPLLSLRDCFSISNQVWFHSEWVFPLIGVSLVHAIGVFKSNSQCNMLPARQGQQHEKHSPRNGPVINMTEEFKCGRCEPCSADSVCSACKSTAVVITHLQPRLHSWPQKRSAEASQTGVQGKAREKEGKWGK